MVVVFSCGELLAATEIEVESVVLQLLKEANVPAQEAGVLVNLKVREGSRVERRELLAQIDDRAARLAEKTASIELESARAEAENDVSIRYAAKAHEVAEAELARSSQSIRKFAGSVSESQLDVERLNVQKTALEQEQAEHQRELKKFDVELKQEALAAARLQVQRRRIAAPFAGTVVEVFVRPGEWIEPGQKALRMVATDTLKAEGFVHADHATKDIQGATVRLLAAANQSDGSATDGQTFTGKVTFVSPEMDPITEQVRIWAEIDNVTSQLRPGQRVRMWIVRE